jgi:hypothetical protein
MAELQPHAAVASGGLDLVTSPYELLRNPNVATDLVNFEVSIAGGYRRINGYTAFGTTRPEGANQILGIYPYALGVVVVVDTSIYYSEDGDTWLQINKDTTSGGKTEAQMPGTAALNRPLQGRTQFSLMRAPNGRTTTTYGSLTIATGGDLLGRFRIEGTGGSRLFYFETYTTGAPTGGTYIANHENHLCVVDTINAPSTVYYSANNDDSDFTGTGSGSVTLSDKIVGIKSFREILYIFCKDSIYKLTDIDTAAATAVDQVTLNLGCVSGYTIQEIGGDLIFLSTDGFRTIAGTQRLSDIELGTLSKKIHPLITAILGSNTEYLFSSTVLPYKNQYRLFYTDMSVANTVQKGIIGTLRTDDQTGALRFEWSEILGIEVAAIGVGRGDSNREVIYHGDLEGYIYQHEVGDTFNGTAIRYRYKTPDTDFGDASLRSTLYYMLLSIKPEGSTDIKLQVKYDFGSPSIIQPSLQEVGPISFPSYYGLAVYGTSYYGSGVAPVKRINLRGSGTSASFNFSGEDTNPSFTITGFYVTQVPIDRR